MEIRSKSSTGTVAPSRDEVTVGWRELESNLRHPTLVSGSREESRPVCPYRRPVLAQVIETTTGESAVQENLLVLISAPVDAGMLGEVCQDAAVLDPRDHLGVEGMLIEHLTHGDLEPFETLAKGSTDGDRAGVLSHQDIKVRAIDDLVDLVQNQDRGIIGKSEFLQNRVDGLDL